MTNPYERDVVAWAQEQAFWLRSGDYTLVDAQHVAEEIDGVNTRWQHMLCDRCAELLAHLARWRGQEGNRCQLWQRLIELQRQRIHRMLIRMPSLRESLYGRELLEDAWLDALLKVAGEHNCFDLPDASPWPMAQVLDQDFFPD
ncbi:DUF29 family protein [Duganella sp. CY15W]|uniref:DUF29 domain-containing protein n=1 Tax=Duganella sp. CY15W TaxID=2692172 RepID=UPI00136BFAFD|nr:DUF29 domain-containing protein [Duganella sp. CY15W]MYM27210.1 DUF29 family protein [Duganella sp. CY15W]